MMSGKYFEDEQISPESNDGRLRLELKKLTNSDSWVSMTHESSNSNSRSSTPLSLKSTSGRRGRPRKKHVAHNPTKPSSLSITKPKPLYKPKKFRMVLEKDEDYEVDYITPDEDDSSTSSLYKEAASRGSLSDSDFSVHDEDLPLLQESPHSYVMEEDDASQEEDIPTINLPKSSDDLLLPNDLVLKTLSVYEVLRHFRNSLRLSPFLFEDFCAALLSNETTILINECHITLLKLLLKEEDSNNTTFVPLDQKDAHNAALYFIDHLTWPEVLRSYVQSSPEFEEILPILEEESFPLVEVKKKIKVLQFLADLFLSSQKIRDKLMMDGSIRYDDHCRVCHRLGDLLCCETCSAVYHLACCDPPLQEVPEEEWQCEVCIAHKLNGVSNCESEAEISGQYLRHDPVGYDRQGRKYWFLARRLFIESEDEIYYYTTYEEFKQVLSKLDHQKYEMVLCEALKDVLEEFPRQAKITEELTNEARWKDDSKTQIELLKENVKKLIEEELLEKEKQSAELLNKEHLQKDKQSSELLKKEKVEEMKETSNLIENKQETSETKTPVQNNVVRSLDTSSQFNDFIKKKNESSDEMTSAISQESVVIAKTELQLGIEYGKTTSITSSTNSSTADSSSIQNIIHSSTPNIFPPNTNAISPTNSTSISSSFVLKNSLAVASTSSSSMLNNHPSLPGRINLSKTNFIPLSIKVPLTRCDAALQPKQQPLFNQVFKINQKVALKPVNTAPVTTLKNLFVLSKDGVKTPLTIGTDGKLKTGLNQRLVMINTNKTESPNPQPQSRLSRELKRLQFTGAGPKMQLTENQTPSSNNSSKENSFTNVDSSMTSANLPIPKLAPLQNNRKPFRLGEDGGYKQYKNYFVENTLALNKYQHKEEKDKERHVGYKFSLTGPVEFEWNGSLCGSRDDIVHTLRSTLFSLEQQVPLCFMHSRWEQYRKMWGRMLVQNDSVKAFAAVLGILEMAIRENAKKTVWKEGFGQVRMRRLTVAEKDSYEKKKKHKVKMTEDLAQRNAVWCKYPLPVRSNLVWKMRGEDYRVTGFGGWMWISATFRCTHQKSGPKPFTFFKKPNCEKLSDKDSERIPADGTVAVIDPIVSELEKFLSSCDVINISKNLLVRSVVYNKRWSASKVDKLLRWRVLQEKERIQRLEEIKKDTDLNCKYPKIDAIDTTKSNKKISKISSPDAENVKVNITSLADNPELSDPENFDDIDRNLSTAADQNYIDAQKNNKPAVVVKNEPEQIDCSQSDVSGDTSNLINLKNKNYSLSETGEIKVKYKLTDDAIPIKENNQVSEANKDHEMRNLQDQVDQIVSVDENQSGYVKNKDSFQENKMIIKEDDAQAGEKESNLVQTDDIKTVNSNRVNQDNNFLQNDQATFFQSKLSNESDENRKASQHDINQTKNIAKIISTEVIEKQLINANNQTSLDRDVEMASEEYKKKRDDMMIMGQNDLNTVSVVESSVGQAINENQPYDVISQNSSTKMSREAPSSNCATLINNKITEDDGNRDSFKTETSNDCMASFEDIKIENNASDKTQQDDKIIENFKTPNGQDQHCIYPDSSTLVTTIARTATSVTSTAIIEEISDNTVTMETYTTTVVTSTKTETSHSLPNNTLVRQYSKHVSQTFETRQYEATAPLNEPSGEAFEHVMVREVSRRFRRTKKLATVHQSSSSDENISSTAKAWKLVKSPADSNKKKSSVKMPIPWNFAVKKEGRKSIFRLPHSSVRHMATRGGLAWYPLGFRHVHKSPASLELFWPYRCVRPTVGTVWRYKLKNAKTLASIAHLLRLLWHSMRWEDIVTKPSTDDVIHTICNDDDIVSIELLKRRNIGNSGLRSEYFVRRIVMPATEYDEEIPKSEAYTPSSRSGLRTRSRQINLRERSKKDVSLVQPKVETLWVPEDQVELWQIRHFDSMVRLQQKAAAAKKEAEAKEAAKASALRFAIPISNVKSKVLDREAPVEKPRKAETVKHITITPALLQAAALHKAQVNSFPAIPTSKIISLDMSQISSKLAALSSQQVSGKKIAIKTTSVTSQLVAIKPNPSTSTNTVTTPGQIPLRPLIQNSALIPSTKVVPKKILLRPNIPKSGEIEVLSDPKLKHPTIKLSGVIGNKVTTSLNQSISSTTTSKDSFISPKPPITQLSGSSAYGKASMQVKLSANQLGDLMKVGHDAVVKVSIQMPDGTPGFGLLQSIPSGAQITPAQGQQLVQCKVGDEIKRFLLTATTNKAVQPSKPADSALTSDSEVSLEIPSLRLRLEQLQQRQQEFIKPTSNNIHRLMTDKDPLWNGRTALGDKAVLVDKSNKKEASERPRKKYTLSNESKEERQRRNVVQQVIKSLLDRIERKEEIEARKRRREEREELQKRKKESIDIAKSQQRIHSRLLHALQRHEEQLKQEIRKRRTITEKYLTYMAQNDLHEDQLKLKKRKTSDITYINNTSSKKSNQVVTRVAASHVLTERNKKEVQKSTSPKKQKRRRSSSPVEPVLTENQPSKKRKMINSSEKLYCICQTPYDDARFYIGCDLCMNWFHGSCVGISERKAKHMDTWVCKDCQLSQPQEELYCLCKTPYDDSQFYIGCDICQDWFHGRCVGISEDQADSIENYTCPRCKKDSRYAVREKSLSTKELSELTKIIRHLQNHKMAWPFLEPVRESDAPGYYKVVTRPMDLQTVMKRLHCRYYSKLSDLVGDVSLIFDNCRQFNGPESNIVKCAEIVETVFVGKIRDMRGR